MKKQILGRVGSILLTVCLLMAAMPLSAAAESGNIYYVATNGSDTNNGSLSAPFATISHAITKMQSGDTCYLRGGTYRETVTISGKSGLTFRAYGNETVSLSGGELITGWQKYQGSIYVADTNLNMYDGRGNILFANGALGIEARWPNASVSDWLSRESYAYADGPERWKVVGQENVRYLTDATIATELPNVDLTGAMVWCAAGDAYWSYLAEVTSHEMSTGTLHLDADAFHTGYTAIKGNMFYITRHLALLDSDNEWYLDTESDKIYYQAPNGADPNTMEIELRAREYAVDVKNSSDIRFYGINVYGGLVNIGSGTSGCGYYDAKLSALDCQMPGSAKSSTRGYGRGESRGVVLSGNGNTLSRCEIFDMFGEGVTLTGSENTVINNYIHDINFEHTYSDGIYIQGSRHLVTHNTVDKTGRSTVGGEFENCIISYNVLSNASRLSNDTGIVYFNAHDYQNSELHHNIISGNDLSGKSDLQLGLYLDSFTSSLLIYNNLICNTETETPDRNVRSLCLNPHSYGNLFANNTFVNTYPAKNWPGYDLSGSVFVNNLFRSAAFTPEVPDEDYGVIYTHNLEGTCNVSADSDSVIESYTLKDYWNDAAGGDYTLAEGSEAIDAGVFVSGVTEDYVGTAPDCGAFEYGQEPWTAGHDFSKNFDDSFSPNTKLPFRNYLQNRGFEESLSKGWVSSGNPQTLSADSWSIYGAYTRDGGKALKLTAAGDGISQTVTGLAPYTSYTVGMFGYLGSDPVRYDTQAKVSLTQLSDYAFSLNFDNGQYDTAILRLQTLITKSVAEANPDLRLEMRLGSKNGEKLASFPLSYSEDGLTRWEWVNATLSQKIRNTQTVYLCPAGGSDSVYANIYFAGIHLASAQTTESIRLSAASSLMSSKVDITGAVYDRPMPTATVMTGADGTLTVSVTKNGSDLNGYADFVTLYEAPDSITGAMSNQIRVADLRVTDASGRAAYGLAAGKTYAATVTLATQAADGTAYTARLLAYNGENFSHAGEAAQVTVSGGTATGTCTATMPLSTEGRLVLSVSDGAGQSLDIELTDALLEAQYQGDGAFAKTTYVCNDRGAVVSQAQAGEFAAFVLTMKNTQSTAHSVLGIMAVYDEAGRLCDMIRTSYRLDAESSGALAAGTLLPSAARQAKLFVWDMSALKPVLENATFAIVPPTDN